MSKSISRQVPRFWKAKRKFCSCVEHLIEMCQYACLRSSYSKKYTPLASTHEWFVYCGVSMQNGAHGKV